MKIYMDACCFIRLSDTSIHDRIVLEAKAITAILEISATKNWTIFKSKPLELELKNAKYPLDAAKAAYRAATTEYLPMPATNNVESYYQTCGIDPLDSLHLSIAQENQVDIFLTTDARLLKRGTKAQSGIKDPVKIANPIDFFMEITDGN